MQLAMILVGLPFSLAVAMAFVSVAASCWSHKRRQQAHAIPLDREHYQLRKSVWRACEDNEDWRDFGKTVAWICLALSVIAALGVWLVWLLS